MKEMELRELLNAIAKKQDFEPSDATIVEMLREEKSLKEYDRDEHRWYTTFKRVVKIEDIYVEFTDYTNSGDEPALDEEESIKSVLSSMKRVYPKKVNIIDYV